MSVRARRSGAMVLLAVLVVAGLVARLVHDANGSPPAVEDALTVAVPVAVATVVVLAVAASLLVALRLLGRWLAATDVVPERLERFARRRIATARLVLPRDTLAAPYEIAKLVDGLSGVLRPRTRWRPSSLLGPASIGLEQHCDATGHVDFIVRAPGRLLPGVLSRMTAAYPGLRHEPIATPISQAHHAIRLKKARRWVWSLQTTKDYSHSTIESLIHVLADRRRPTTVQLLLTPVPSWVERRAAKVVRARERDLRDETRIAGRPGIESVTAQKDLRGAVEGVGRSYFWFDWRVAVQAADLEQAAAVAATLNELRQDNELRPRVQRVRRRLTLKRITRALPQLLPSWRTGILSGAEVGSAWQLPGARVRTVPLTRQTVRELPASRAVSRAATDALLRDEDGSLGLAPRDRRKGLAVIGAAGGGKSSVLLRYIGNAARDRSRAMLVVDLKEDLAKDALTVIPHDRVVHYIDLARPRVGVNVLAVHALAPEVRADIVIAALNELFGDGAVGARSDSLLRNAITAVCIVEETPTLWHVLRMLDPYDASYRDWVVRELDYHAEVDLVRDYWQRTFTGMAKTNARFLAEITEAPSNKLRRFLLVPALQLATNHPIHLDLLEVVRRREVVVINGSKDAVGEANAALFCQLFVMLVQKTLHRVQALDRTERGAVALVIDEAHNVFTPSFATMLSESRSAGLEVVAAFQYSAQITDERVKAGVKSLLQNITVTRIRELGEAREIASLAMSMFSDAIRVEADDQRLLSIDPIDIVNRPDNGTVNLWLADGRPQPAFTATTIPMEPAVAASGGAAARAAHEARQAQRGYHPHDHDEHIGPPPHWTIEGIRQRGTAVDIDVTAWSDCPADLDVVLVELREVQSSEWRVQAARPLDTSGRRYTVPLLGCRRGTYRVDVVARAGADAIRWSPLVGEPRTPFFAIVA